MTLSEAIQYKPHPYSFICIPTEAKYGTIDEVMQVVNDRLSITPDQLKKHDRTANVREARQMVMAYCTIEIKLPLHTVAKYFVFDHTTVLHSRDLIKHEIANNTALGNKYKKTFRL